MSLQLINLGTVANDGTGDPIRVAFEKVNANFTELYQSTLPELEPVQADWTESNVLSANYIQNKPTLFSGSYTDLTNKPTLFSGSYTDLTNKPVLFNGDYNNLINLPDLFSGDYNDLRNKPALSGGGLAPSWNDITDKPMLFSGSYIDLTNKPTIPTDVNQLTDVDSLLTSIDLSNYSTKTYVDDLISSLINSAPAALNTLSELATALGSDANFATTVVNQISTKANSADLSSVATTGSYNDLTNKPTIPTDISDLTDTQNILANAGGGGINIVDAGNASEEYQIVDLILDGGGV